MVACPENSLVRSGEFMQPVVTPLELELALNPARKWTGRLSAEFADLLPGRRDFVELPEEAAEEEEGDVSLVTGKVRTLMDAKRTGRASSSSFGEVATSETTVSLLHQGGGGDFLSGRSWRGLEQRLGETEVAKATMGHSGIAVGYQGEGGEDEK